MNSEEKLILQKWLAARYRRTALPDAFNRRLKSIGLEDRISKILAPTSDNIIALFFDVSDDENPDDQVYELSVVVLYTTHEDPIAAERVSSDAATKIREAFDSACKSNGEWRHFELLDCLSVSDQVFTVAQERRLKKWNADYFSLRSEPQGETRD
jgi:hypothetical protein